MLAWILKSVKAHYLMMNLKGQISKSLRKIKMVTGDLLLYSSRLSRPLIYMTWTVIGKIPFRESSRKSYRGKSDRGLKLSSKIHDTRGLYAVRVSPRMFSKVRE